MKLKELPNTVVHCRTRDDYDCLMQIYQDAGWRWSAGQRPTEFDAFSAYRNDTRVEAKSGFAFGSMKNAYERVLTLEGFLKEQGLAAPFEELQVGDWVEVAKSFDEPHSRGDWGMHRFRKGERYKVVDDEGFGFAVETTPHGPIDMLDDTREKFRKCHPPEEPTQLTITTDAFRPSLHYTVTYQDNPFISFTPSFMDCCNSVVQKARDLALSSIERKYRKLGLKDEHGLTREGRHVFTDLLFQKFGKELMDPVVKKLDAKDEDDE